MDANESYDKTDTHFNPIWTNGPFVTKWSHGTKTPWWDANNWRSVARKKMLIVFFLFNNGGQKTFEPLEKQSQVIAP